MKLSKVQSEKISSMFPSLFARHEEKIAEWAKRKLAIRAEKLKIIISEAETVKFIKDVIEANEAKLIFALFSKLEGLNIQNIKEIHATIGKQGIEGFFEIILEDGTEGTIETQSIYAGGYNVQCLHYRYLIKISDNLEPKRVKPELEFTEDQKSVIAVFREEIKTFDIKFPIVKNKKLSRYGHGRFLSFLTKHKFLETRSYFLGIGYAKLLFITEKGKEFFLKT